MYLPKLASKALGIFEGLTKVQPSDDVVYVLHDLFGSCENLTSETGKEGVFQVLAPVEAGIRTPLARNRLSTKGEVERNSEMWGYLNSNTNETYSEAESGGTRTPLNRSELLYNLIRHRLGLPLYPSNYQQTETDGVIGCLGSHRSRAFHSDLTTNSSLSRLGPGLPDRTFEDQLDNSADSIRRSRLHYDTLASALLGPGGIAGMEFARQEAQTDASQQDEQSQAQNCSSNARRRTPTNNGTGTPLLWKSDEPLTVGKVIRDARLRTQTIMHKNLQNQNKTKQIP